MHASISSTGNHRARWAAIGAAVAVSLGAGGLGIVNATSPDGASAYVPISPCRLLDTRADSPVGSPLGALGPDTEITVDGWGAHGNCTLPTDTTGLELNVTAVDASTLTNLRIYPEGVDTPTASNLNPAPGEPPTPNSVTAPLNTTNGQFHVFNRFGTVHIVIDVVGYYTDHMHDGDDIIDESLTGADVMDESLTGADIDDHSVSNLDTSNEPGVQFATFATGLLGTNVTGNTVIGEIVLRAPSAGYITVDVAGTIWHVSNDVDVVNCGIVGPGETGVGPSWVTSGDGGSTNLNTFHPISLTRTFEVDSAGNKTFQIVCNTTQGTNSALKFNTTATFTATRYSQLLLLPPLVCPPFCIIELDEPAVEE